MDRCEFVPVDESWVQRKVVEDQLLKIAAFPEFDVLDVVCGSEKATR